jgi:hypothetical protein
VYDLPKYAEFVWLWAYRVWNNKRVKARVFVEIDGEEVPIFKEGTMFVNSDKTTLGGLPYVLKYDDH